MDETFTVEDGPGYKLFPNVVKAEAVKEGKFDESFNEGSSVYVSHSPNIVFEKTINVGVYEHKNNNLERLLRILA